MAYEIELKTENKIKEAIRKGLCKDETEAINFLIQNCDIEDLEYDNMEVRPRFLRRLEKRIKKNDTIKVEDFAERYGLK